MHAIEQLPIICKELFLSTDITGNSAISHFKILPGQLFLGDKLH